MAWKTLAAAVALVAAPLRVDASLGGDQSSVQADRAHMLGAMRQYVQRDRFAYHEFQSASGIVVREYVTSTGTVFGLAWQGMTHPDLRQLLGPYFDRFQQEVDRQARTRRGHGPVTVDLGDLIVQTAGHARALSGRAVLPRLMPQGVTADVIR